MPHQHKIPYTGKGIEVASTGLRILIVDDNKVNRMILSKLLSKAGHTPLTANNGREGVELFEREYPDLVIMDIMMPVMDGYEATRIIKEKARDFFVPVIAVTGVESEKDLAACIAAGADDFLSKPVSATILNAKIASMMRIRALYNTVNNQREALKVLIDEKDREMEFAEKIYSQIVYNGSTAESNIDYYTSPMAIFSGDILLMARGPSGEINIIMGDFTGHGLSAAMGAIPTAEIFYAMTAKGHALNDIVLELNRKLKELLPPNIFLAAGLIQMDGKKRTAIVWSGAVPDIYVLDREGGIKKRLRSRNLPLGVVDNQTLGSTVEVTPLADGDRLFFFSDGVVEALREDGEMFGDGRLEACLNQNRGGRLLEEVNAALNKFRGGQSQNDDVTMVEITCDGHLSCPIAAAPADQGKSGPFDWKTVVELSPGRIRDADPLPMIMRMLMQDSALVPHKENLFLIISEFFTNALDHGLLGMDGSLKQTVDGMIEYMTKREKALSVLETGAITVEVKHIFQPGGRALVIRVEDSGPGFDYRVEGPCLSETCSLGGRGIELVRSLCKEVVFHGTGNIVEAVYVVQ